MKGRKLICFKKDHEEIASTDLTKMLELKGPEQGSYESKCSFQIILQDRYVLYMSTTYMYCTYRQTFIDAID